MRFRWQSGPDSDAAGNDDHRVLLNRSSASSPLPQEACEQPVLLDDCEELGSGAFHLSPL